MNGKISPLRRTGEFVLSSRSLYGFTFFSPADLYLPAKGTLKFCDAVITECGVSCFMLLRSEKPAEAGLEVVNVSMLFSRLNMIFIVAKLMCDWFVF